MRKIAKVFNHAVIKRVMIYSNNDMTYLFLYNTLQDLGCLYDQWFKTLTEAEKVCKEIYNIDKKDWQVIADPLPSCRNDRISPVKI